MARNKFDLSESPILSDFIRDDSFVRGVCGPVGSGKSSAMSVEIMRRASEQAPQSDGIRRTRAVVVRNTYGELRDTTINTFLDWFPEGVYGRMNRAEMLYEINYGDIHCEVLFRALDRPDDIKKLLSLELTFGWINEAREIPLAIVEMLQTRLGRYPGKADGGPTWFGMWMDTNPPDEDHWWYRLAEEQQPEFHRFWRQPSGRGPDAENVNNLPSRYYERMMAGKAEEWIRVYVDGEYGFVQDGKPVYPEYRDTIHCQEFEPWHNSESPTIFVGIDFGLTPAATLGQRSGMGQLRVFDELVMERGGAIQLAEALKPVLARYPGYRFKIEGDPSGGAGASTDSEQTVFRILQANGINCFPSQAANNNETQRREAGRGPMLRMVDGEPGLLLHPRCTKLRKALAGRFCYRRLKVSGDARFTDSVDKNEYSHVAEAYEYMAIASGENPRININQPPPKPVRMKQKWSPYG